RCNPLEKSWELSREFAVRVQSHPMPTRVLVDVRELALRVDLAHATAGVDEEYISLRIHHNAGSRMSESAGSGQPRNDYRHEESYPPATLHDCVLLSRHTARLGIRSSRKCRHHCPKITARLLMLIIVFSWVNQGNCCLALEGLQTQQMLTQTVIIVRI